MLQFFIFLFFLKNLHLKNYFPSLMCTRLPLTLTDDEDLGRLISRCLRLGRLHFVEELLKDPDKWLIVFRAEHLGDKRATFRQELAGQLEGHEGQMRYEGDTRWEVRGVALLNKLGNNKGNNCSHSNICECMLMRLDFSFFHLIITYLVRRHHVASWLQHWERRHLTQHRPSRSEVLFVVPAYRTEGIRH